MIQAFNSGVSQDLGQNKGSESAAGAYNRDAMSTTSCSLKNFITTNPAQCAALQDMTDVAG
jgi:hypothetical protein